MHLFSLLAMTTCATMLTLLPLPSCCRPRGQQHYHLHHPVPSVDCPSTTRKCAKQRRITCKSLAQLKPITFVDEYNLNLSGPQIRSDTRHPISSAFEENKKAHSTKGRTARWRDEFDQRGMSKDDIEHHVELATKNVEQTAKERVGPHKDLVCRRKQCIGLNGSIKAIPRNNNSLNDSGLSNKKTTND